MDGDEQKLYDAVIWMNLLLPEGAFILTFISLQIHLSFNCSLTRNACIKHQTYMVRTSSHQNCCFSFSFSIKLFFHNTLETLE